LLESNETDVLIGMDVIWSSLLFITLVDRFIVSTACDKVCTQNNHIGKAQWFKKLGGLSLAIMPQQFCLCW